MINRPKFKEKYHVEVVENEGIFLLSENEHHVLEGESMHKIVPLINGNNTWQDIIEKVQPDLGEQATQFAINLLVQNGHVVEKDDLMPSHYEPFWTELGKNSQQVLALTSVSNIHFKAVGNADASPFISALHSFGFRMDPSSPPTFILVITDDYQYPEIGEINNYALSVGIPWMLVKPYGLKPIIGPIFKLGATACWKCLETRLKHNREVESYIQRKKNRASPFPLARTRVPLAEQQAISLTVLQITKFISLGYNQELFSRLLSMDMLNLNQSFHYLSKRPQCEACGDPSLATEMGKRVTLQAMKAQNVTENGIRSEPPEATFNRYAHLISEFTGVVKGVFPSQWHGVGPLKVYMAGHNFALKNDELYFLKDGLRNNSSGKGKSDAQARTSALCEALERYSGLFRKEEPTIQASYNAIKEEAIDPNDCMLFSDKQFKERTDWNSRGSRFQVVPNRLDKDAEISWSPVWSYFEEKNKYFPTSYCFYGFRDSEEKFYAWGDSNGNAAGSTFEDAILQGFLELVERDAVCIWWYNRIQRKEVDLDSLNDPFINELQAFFKERNRNFWVLELTTDIGIPAFVAINRRVDHEKEDIIMGFGAHLDARIGIMRAITEMNQFVPAVLNQDENGDTQYHYHDQDALNWWQNATIKNQPYLLPIDNTKIKIANLQSNNSKDIKGQVEYCFNRMKKMGHEVYILNQTRPDIGIPVAKIIVPGLRHFWARLAPGRLYDVPVKMGWLQKPLKEDELNPIAMFL